jgi:hypothetical protein
VSQIEICGVRHDAEVSAGIVVDVLGTQGRPGRMRV